MALMDKKELDEKLAQAGLNLREACTLIYNLTDQPIDSRAIYVQFNRSHYLSRNLSAIFRLFFKFNAREQV